MLAEQKKKEESREAANRMLKIMGMTLLVMGAGAIFFFLCDQWNNRRSYQKSSPDEKLMLDIYTDLSILKFMGYEREQGETLSELKERILEGEKAREQELPLTFIDFYEEVVYGERKVTKEVLSKGEKEKEQLLELLKEKKGRAYFYYRLRLYLESGKNNPAGKRKRAGK